ncbi:fatty acyl-CoA reductase 1-like [Aricia agestis]|uniref:fatty acyl-CoA reductase 1-like n=1 Tax=Aricia agestis TaxID=91739 RepID=UPI001C20534D|nr:fatty acyl-CoA reductase 1-like [Aricia agestis]XP_041970549.1 fatty acyl-CoA reductase 1-like [Aricia agestis]
MTRVDELDFNDIPTIPEYYKGKTIFITGGTGFLGKLLIEKLLYSCSDLKHIYLFIRAKKGVSPEQRLENLYKNSCFDRLRKEKSGLFHSKITVVPGNMIEKDLGMSERDRAFVLENTNIIIHAAATVRFDETLDEALETNLIGALKLIELAKLTRNLESYVHVSTSFCNLDYERVIQEKMYPPAADWREIREIVYNTDPAALRVLTPKLLGKFPNAYAFTKNLTEHAVYELRGKLPIVIVRPSIVTGCMSEPFPGWIDNFNGPVGLLTAAAQGILRTVYADKDAKNDYVPADIVIKGTLIAAWTRGIKKLDKTDDIPIYNACVGEEQGTSLTELHAMGEVVTPLIAFEYTLRPIYVIYTHSKFFFTINMLISHFLLAVVVDTILRVVGGQPRLLKVQRRVLIANIALEYFMTRTWCFANDNFVRLPSLLPPQDRDQFHYKTAGVKLPEHLYNAGLILRRDLLHQNEKSLPKWRKIYRWQSIIDRIVSYTFYAFISWWVLGRLLATAV